MGLVADGDFFAGRVLDAPIAGGRLWRCRACRSMFKHPLQPAALYSDLYAQGRAEQWSGTHRRRDFELAAALIANWSRRGSVLDVGCGTGEFLSMLPKDLPRHGIEPSAAAAAVAQAAGISILGADLAAVGGAQCFDAITLIDVIEHASNVPALLRSALDHLRPDGLLLVSTGDPTCPAFRCFGARFWYATFPEHIVFPSQKFLELWGAEHGLELVHAQRFRYHPRGAVARIIGQALQLGYAGSPSSFNAMCRLLPLGAAAQAPGRRMFSPGLPGAFLDHQLVLLRRRDGGAGGR